MILRPPHFTVLGLVEVQCMLARCFAKLSRVTKCQLTVHCTYFRIGESPLAKRVEVFATGAL